MKDKTKLIAAGRPHRRYAHPVNTPVERASTILFPTYDDYLEGARSINYGRLGTSTHRSLETAITLLEGGFETRLAPSGLAACNASILAFVGAGDHILVTDAAYDPTRKFCENFLSRFGVETTFYDPLADKEAIAELMRPETKVVFAESPGSLTFETQDLPALAEAAHENDAVLIVDNTWAAGYFCKPIALGADVSIQAATKYVIGHADALVGTVTSANEQAAKKIFKVLLQLGSNVSADDAFLALRGLRTLSSRLEQHQENALAMAKWLNKRAEVARVIHPAFKTTPGHATWKRDFTGASGLFAAVLKPVELPALKAFFDALKIFGIGFSWGGFESLAVHVHPERYRTASTWDEEGPTIRFHAGLEDIDDLKADIDNAFTAMNMAQNQSCGDREFGMGVFKIGGGALGALMLSGCLATGGESRTINSTPSGALVTIEGYGECETPCTIKLDGRRQITVAKAGYDAQRFAIEPGSGAVNVVLELAAPTESIATETLPELQYPLLIWRPRQDSNL